MSLLRDQIEECIGNQKFLDIYRGRLCGDETIFGKIIDISEELIAIVVFEEDYYDGISVIKIEDITRVRWGGNSRTTQEIAIQRNSIDIQMPSINISSIQTAIKDLNKAYKCVTIHTEEIDDEICFIGAVEKIDDNYVQLHEYGSMSTLDRSYLTLPICDITQVSVDSKYERDLMYVHSKKKDIISLED